MQHIVEAKVLKKRKAFRLFAARFLKFAKTMGSFIKAISYYLPEKIYSNEDFFRDFPNALAGKDNLLKIGVLNRRWVEPDVTASDIAIKAAEKLFDEHKIDRSDIDFLLFCAQESDYYSPTTACLIHEKLGLKKNCGALDFNLACSGFVYGISLAKGLIESSGLKNVLLLTSSTLTKKFHPKDKNSAFLFGDGAAATLISARAEKGIGNFIFGTDGKGVDKIIVRDGGGRHPITQASSIEQVDEYGNTTSDETFFMNGTSIFIFGLRVVPGLIKDILDKEKMTVNDIDLFIFHQANLFMLESIRKKMDLPEEKMFNYMENTGNTVSSTIPIALYEAMRAGKVKKGDTLLVVGFGAGLSWAAATLKL